MPKLNDTQLILLSTAAQRENHSLFPLPETLRAGSHVTKAIKSLIDKSLAEELETQNPVTVSRVNGDLSFGIFLTFAGMAALDCGPEGEASAPVPVAPKPARESKSAAVIALLQRDKGATLADLIAATDWLPHTTRAALTGLRKKGHAIERGKRDDVTFYRIAAAV